MFPNDKVRREPAGLPPAKILQAKQNNILKNNEMLWKPKVNEWRDGWMRWLAQEEDVRNAGRTVKGILILIFYFVY